MPRTRLLSILLTNFCTCVCISFFCVALLAGDLTGKWSGTVTIHDPGSGETTQAKVTLTIQQNGKALTGKIGRPDDEAVEIKNGTVNGSRVTFEAFNGETASPAQFTLTTGDGTMQGTMSVLAEAGTRLTGEVKLVREKP